MLCTLWVLHAAGAVHAVGAARCRCCARCAHCGCCTLQVLCTLCMLWVLHTGCCARCACCGCCARSTCAAAAAGTLSSHTLQISVARGPPPLAPLALGSGRGARLGRDRAEGCVTPCPAMDPSLVPGAKTRGRAACCAAVGAVAAAGWPRWPGGAICASWGPEERQPRLASLCWHGCERGPSCFPRTVLPWDKAALFSAGYG